jgi:hypothetical protein
MPENDVRRPALSKLLLRNIPFRFGVIFLVLGAIPLVFFYGFGRDVFEPNTVLVPGTYNYAQTREWVLVLVSMFEFIGGSLSIFCYVKCRRLAAHGVIIVGQVCSVGTFRYRGMKNITYTYTVGEQKYKERASVAVARANNLNKHPDILLLVDPGHTKSHLTL